MGGTDYNKILLFDWRAHRSFIDRSIQKLTNQLSGLLALALEETLPGACVARFQNWLLCEAVEKKARNFPRNFLPEFVQDELEAAFPGQRFPFTAFEIEELSEIEEEP